MRQSDMNDPWLGHGGVGVGVGGAEHWATTGLLRTGQRIISFIGLLGKWRKVKPPQIREEFCNPRLVSVLVLQIRQMRLRQIKILGRIWTWLGWKLTWYSHHTAAIPWEDFIVQQCRLAWSQGGRGEMSGKDWCFLYRRPANRRHT